MLPVQDSQLRLVLLTLLASWVERNDDKQFPDVGIPAEQLARLRRLTVEDLQHLAFLRHPIIGIVLDGTTFTTGLRNLGARKTMRTLEQYFVRHGASAAMLKALFKMPLSEAVTRLRTMGYAVLPGRPRLPEVPIRERIYRFWCQHADLDLRSRYYQLHETFPTYSLSVLGGVIRDLEHLE